ncbi:MAG: ABC transporter permease [Christensenellales bacterium]|jgi:ribose/xylose/arabinose/galactoside ABC-type transport system permease subunit
MQTNLDLRERRSVGDVFKATFKNETFVMLLVLIGYSLFVNSQNSNFISFNNIRNISVQVSITGVLTCGMFMTLLTVGTDLSVAWMLTFLGCGAVELTMTYNWPIWLVVITVFVVAMALEGLMGYIIAKTGLSSFIISLGFQAMYMSFAYLLSDGSMKDIGGKLDFINTFPVAGISTLVFIFVAVVLISWLLLRFTKYGRRMYAVGNNSEAAYLSGINVVRFKVSVFMINGFCVALATVMAVARLNSSSPSMATGYEIAAIAACVVGGTSMSGGKGKILSAVVGIFLLGCIKNSMTMMSLSPYYSDLFRGLIIVVAVILSQTTVFRRKYKKQSQEPGRPSEPDQVQQQT